MGVGVGLSNRADTLSSPEFVYCNGPYVNPILDSSLGNGYQHFLSFPQCFGMLFFLFKVVKIRDYLVKGWTGR